MDHVTTVLAYHSKGFIFDFEKEFRRASDLIKYSRYLNSARLLRIRFTKVRGEKDYLESLSLKISIKWP